MVKATAGKETVILQLKGMLAYWPSQLLVLADLADLCCMLA